MISCLHAATVLAWYDADSGERDALVQLKGYPKGATLQQIADDLHLNEETTQRLLVNFAKRVDQYMNQRSRGTVESICEPHGMADRRIVWRVRSDVKDALKW